MSLFLFLTDNTGTGGIGQVVQELNAVISNSNVLAKVTATNIIGVVKSKNISASIDSIDLNTIVQEQIIKGEINEC